jgi:hypothetical protein
MSAPRAREVALALLVGAALFCLDVLRASPGQHVLRAVLLSFASALIKFLLFGAVGVVLWQLLGRIPVDDRPRGRTVAIHLAASLGLSAAVTTLAGAAQWWLRPALLAALPAGASGRLLASWTGGSHDGLGPSLALAFPWDLLTYWALLAGLAFWQWALRTRERERRALELSREVSRAELHALETQLHPHFLFNALHTIAALLSTDRPAARSITGRLRQLFARLLAARERPVQPLDRELAWLDDYLAIQKARFGDRLQVEVERDEGCGAALVPLLLLQPLVENAVRHAAERRAGPTRIRVSARRHDDGPGCQTPARAAGIGLPNTRQRLQRMYGPGQRFEVTGSAPPWGGVRVHIELPFRTTAPAAGDPLPDRPAPAPPDRLWLVGWLVFSGAMLVLNVIWVSARYYGYARHQGLSWADELVAGSRGAAALVLLFPLIYAVNRRLISRVPSLAGRVALHAGAALGLSLAKSSLVRALALVLGGPQGQQPILAMVLFRIYADLLHYAVMAGICQALEQWRRQREQALANARLESDLARAHLEARRRALEPDRLLASLDRLETAIDRAPHQADQLVARLGDSLRALLREGPGR